VELEVVEVLSPFPLLLSSLLEEVEVRELTLEG
jgi:hypothetical protein